MMLVSNDMICLEAWGPLSYTEGKYRYCMAAIDQFIKIAIPIPIKAVNRQIMQHFMITIVGHLAFYILVLVHPGQKFG
jgi:hypothetical protein